MKVFVYGTLLSGESNNYILIGSKKLGDVTVSGLDMYDLGSFPACKLTTSNRTVVGEVWEINEKTLERLDWLEGYPNFYNRVEIETSLGKAWVYINENVAFKTFIESGDWKKYNWERE